MKTLKVLGALLAVGLLSGCVGNDIEAMRNASATGSPFTRALAEEYRAITVFEADEMYDWVDAGYFATKGLQAAEGTVVEPESVGNWDVPESRVGELQDARSRLVGLLDATARDKAPELAARTQGRYDCWIEQQEENHQPDHIAACRDQFYAALAELEAAMAPEEMPMAAPESYVVYFDFDKSEVRDDAANTIREAIQAARDAGFEEFAITGHTDLAGSAEYNMGLSQRRADAVANFMVAQGVARGDISTAARGESEPAVPTEDGVRLQANRRAEIIIQ